MLGKLLPNKGVFFQMMSDINGATLGIKVISCLNIQMTIYQTKFLDNTKESKTSNVCQLHCHKRLFPVQTS